MKKIIIAGALLAVFSACTSNENSGKENAAQGVHSAVVLEVLQGNDFTYLRVRENGTESWLAVPLMAAVAGETYYYKDGLAVKDVENKELNRKFAELLYLDQLSKSPELASQPASTQPPANAESGHEPSAMAGEDAHAGHSHQQSVVAEEVLQTSQYTYIRAKIDNKDQWLATAKMEASVGKTYQFEGGLLMTDFPSKELKRTFKEILFVDNMFDASAIEGGQAPAAQAGPAAASKGSAIDMEKKDIKLSHSGKDLTIAKLLENKKSYEGKKVKLIGQVTKFSPGIMKRNWIHLQDGTDYGGKFDLTVTTDEMVNVGDNITVEGQIMLDVDFGFGYFYEVIMADAKILK